MVASLIFFKSEYFVSFLCQLLCNVTSTKDHYFLTTGKSWPIIVGSGFGLGAAFADISNEVNRDS